MKRFVLKTTIFFVIAQVIIALIWRGLVMFPNNHSRLSNEVNVARQIERMQRIKEPKIVFCGGSGLAFGLCSSIISKHFNMPVCNTGTHAGIGLRLHLMLYMDYVSKGDIIVATEEYQEYYGQVYLGEETALGILATNYPDGFKKFSLPQQLHMFKYVPRAFADAYSVRRMKEIWDGAVSSDSMNVYGDIVSQRTKPCPLNGTHPLELSENLQVKALVFLQEIAEYCEQKGAIFLVFPPACRNSDFKNNAETINRLWGKMEEMNLPIVSSPKTYCFPDSLFCDASPYHLTTQGAEYRTMLVIKDIENYLKN